MACYGNSLCFLFFSFHVSNGEYEYIALIVKKNFSQYGHNYVRDSNQVPQKNVRRVIA
jgi:hypothetical protein